MPGRSRGRPMFDVRPENGTGEELYPDYPGYGDAADPGDVYDDHDSREREAPVDRRPARPGPPAVRPGYREADPRNGSGRIGRDGRWDESEPPLYGGRAGRDDDDDEPLYARDYAPQGHDFGDPDDDARPRPVNGRPPARAVAPVRDDAYDEAYDDEDYGDDYDEDEDYDEEGYDDDEYGVGDAPLSVPPPGRDGRPLGPADVEELDPSMTDALARVDLGSMQVPVPYGAELKLEPTEGGRPQAVHLMLPEGRIAVSALAAPRSSGLWHELSAEIETSLRNGGARVRNAQGDWGRELHARTENAASVFIGADGPRWMVYGVATASLETVDALDVELRRVLRGVIVVRGKLPYPPRTVLPLALPEHLAEKQPEAAKPKGASITVSVPAGSTTTGATPRPGATGSTPAPAATPVGPPVRPAATARPTGATPAREPVVARAAEADPVASTRSIPQVARPPRRDADGAGRAPSERREAPVTRTGAAPRVPREPSRPAAPAAGARPESAPDGVGAGPGTVASTGRLAARRADVAPPVRDTARSRDDGDRGRYDESGRGDDRYTGDRRERDPYARDRYADDRYSDERYVDDRYVDDRTDEDRDPDGYDTAGYDTAGYGAAGSGAARTGGYPSHAGVDRSGARSEGSRGPAVSGRYRTTPEAPRIPDEPVAARSGGFDAVPEPVEPPVRRDPAVTALSPADLVPDPASLRTGRTGTSGTGRRTPGEQAPRRRRADRPRGGLDATPAADLLRTAGSVPAAYPGPGSTDEPDPADRTPIEPMPVSRMAIEDIPLADVPLLDAELDAVPAVDEPLADPVPDPFAEFAPAPATPPGPATGAADAIGGTDPIAGSLPRRLPRSGTNGSARPVPSGPVAGGRRRRGDAGDGHRPEGTSSSWMSAEIAARPGGRHARPGGRPASGDVRPSPLDPEPPRNGYRLPLTDWRDTAHREPGLGDPASDGSALFSSPAEAGERYRRNGNGNGHRPADRIPFDDPDPGPDPDLGRHRR